MRVRICKYSSVWSGSSGVWHSKLTTSCSVCFSTVDINPNGRNYASGAEDGYVRLHHFDKDYLDMKDPVPEEGEEDEDDAIEDEPDEVVPAAQ
jgi:hypothetical protein